MDNEKIIKRYMKVFAEKQKFIDMYKIVYQFILPDRYTQVEDEAEGQNKRVDLYTSVPEQAADRFVQSIQNLLVPVNRDWIGFKAGFSYTSDGSDPIEVNQNLEKLAKMCNVFKDASNFDSEITSFFYDLIPGTAFLFIQEGTPENPLVFKTIPFKEIAIEEGVDGLPSHYYREFRMKNESIKEQWTDAKFDYKPEKAQEQIELLEVTYKDKEKWAYKVIDKKEKNTIVEKVFKTSPFIALRWTKASGEIYGRGCGLKSLSDIRTLNKIKDYSLRALGLSLPIFTASEDGGYDPANFKAYPGAVNPVPSNMTNNPTISQLQVTQQPDIMQFNATQLEMDIKKNMFDTTIPNDPKRMTATEIDQRTAELANRLNNSFGRLINEFMYPLVRRILEVLQKFGYVDEGLDLMKFNGYGFKILINTQLANQQRAGELNDIINFFNFVAQIDPQMQFISKLVDINKLGVEFAKLSGIPFDCIRTAEEIHGMQEQEAMAMQQQQQQAMADQVNMSNAIEQGKADAKRAQ